jgi:hypothetical protein
MVHAHFDSLFENHFITNVLKKVVIQAYDIVEFFQCIKICFKVFAHEQVTHILERTHFEI